MIKAQAFDVSTCEPVRVQSFVLYKNIAAIQVLPSESSTELRLGMITQLPSGAELIVCGDGFNDRTVKVRWAEGFYFVFLQDLEQRKSFGAAT